VIERLQNEQPEKVVSPNNQPLGMTSIMGIGLGVWLSDFRASLGPPGYDPTPARQVSLSPQPYQNYVGLQRASEKIP
jgi:hypothetical protein